MKYENAVQYFHSLEAFGIRPGLSRIRALCAALGDPQKQLRFLHVAGTNGKGSTSTILARVLQAQGYKTGLFTSPYVVDFRERMQINGQMIPPETLADCTALVKTQIDRLAAEGQQVTEFEAVTAAAFLYFAREHCDFVVLEVGLGGRFDATNVIAAPEIVVLTSISLDHTAILGDTVEKIAFEKCGILKRGCTAISYPLQTAEALRVIRARCAEETVPLVIPALSALQVDACDAAGSVFRYRDLTYQLPLAGAHMIYNCITALEALYALRDRGVLIEDAALAGGVASVAMPARIETLRANPPVLLDGGHNEGCAEALATYLRAQLAGRRIVAVCSLMSDKDYAAYLRIVAPLADRLIATEAPVPRALDADTLAAAAAPYCKETMAIADPVQAVKTAFEELGPADALVVCGSFYLAGAVRTRLQNF